jgi:5-methylcytosine-specific restriction endonuclease McrA
MRFIVFFLTLFICVDASAAARSNAARKNFARLHPCPSTGQAKLPCPGYQIDHVVPLKCGGADHPGNMQWLSIKAHKQKTKREAKLCRKPYRKASPGAPNSGKRISAR